MLVHSLLRRAARTWPGKTAIVAAGTSYGFGDIDRKSDALAARLQSLGVAKGDRVATVLENAAEMVIALWATLKAGAVFTPLHSATKAKALGFILQDSGARCLFAPFQHRQKIAEALEIARQTAPAGREPPVVIWTGDAVASGIGFADLLAAGASAGPQPTPAEPRLIDQDLALLIYTSGSTGEPKGVMMTHHAVGNNARCITRYLEAVESDVALCVLPLSFGYGLFQILTGALSGSAVVVERSFAFPYDTLKRMAEHRVTALPGVPTLFARILELAPFEGLDLSPLRYVTNAAAAFPPAHIRRLREVWPQVKIFSMYGLTECTRVCYLEPERIDAKIHSVGKSMPNCEAYIVDEEGRRLPPGAVGELVVRGANLMRGYWRRPEETARVLRDGELSGEKVLHTGDLFRQDEDGDLYFVGRKDDMFKCRGEKVSPREIENALFELQEIAEAAVIGVPDPIDGMAIKAFVVLREGCALGENALRRHCALRLEQRLTPRFFEFCPSLPKTESGKITRRLLRRAAE